MLLQTLELSLQSCSLFCVDVSKRSSSWAAPSVVDLPGSHLIRAGYSLIASEPCLRLSFSLGDGEEGALLHLRPAQIKLIFIHIWHKGCRGETDNMEWRVDDTKSEIRRRSKPGIGQFSIL